MHERRVTEQRRNIKSNLSKILLGELAETRFSAEFFPIVLRREIW